ncbi:hypothetical protein F3087_25635 [Nocardia colli]|uniref:Uncharacterized protein n=1 Tax=Nocardia colli TaxID=2545717 RepID=A0A5N0EAN8_9NOCA|nr:hypothetical protein [Nocardia colli]KAA8886003.1 hypothetical protein F3087_25635 [Nocardia colli]
MVTKTVAMGFVVLAASGLAMLGGAGSAVADAPQPRVYPGLSMSECLKLTDDARRKGAVTAQCLPDGPNKKAVITFR